MPITIQLNKELDIKTDIQFLFNAKYSDSILSGFYYRNGVQHSAWDYVFDVLIEFDLEAAYKEGLEQTESLKKAAEWAAESLYLEFQEHLQKAPVNTLNWWIEDYQPAENIEIKYD